MGRTCIIMADGCEEIEGLAVVDILRRANLEITMVSLQKTVSVTGSHNITFLADAVFEEVNFQEFDAVVLPGGMPGTLHLLEHAGVHAVVKEFAAAGKLAAAICAAPSVLGAAGILNGRRAVCHPGFEEKLLGAEVVTAPAVTDGNIITSRGMGTAIDFGLAIVEYFKGEETVHDLKKALVYRQEA